MWLKLLFSNNNSHLPKDFLVDFLILLVGGQQNPTHERAQAHGENTFTNLTRLTAFRDTTKIDTEHKKIILQYISPSCTPAGCNLLARIQLSI